MLAILHKLLFGTLRRQLVLGVAAVHAVMMSLFVWDLTLHQETMLLDRQAEQAEAMAQTLATSSAGWAAARDISGLQEIAEAQRRYPELTFALITGPDGRVLAHTDHARVGQYVKDMPDLRQHTVIHRSEELVDVATPMFLGERHVGWVRVGIGQRLAGARLDEIIRDGLLYALAAIVIGALLAWWMGRRLTRRLAAIQSAADAVKAGRREHRAQVAGEDEAALLAWEFNAMLDAIAQRESQLRESREALARSEERFDLAMRGANDGIWDWDLPRDQVYFSPRWKGMIGYGEDEIGDTRAEWSDRVHPDDLPGAEAAMKAYLDGLADKYEVTYRFRHRDGHYLWVLSRATILRGMEGHPVRVVGTHMDITARMRLEAQLHDEKELAQVTLRSIGDAVVTTDAEGRVTFLNPVAERLTGWASWEATGRLVTEVTPLLDEDGHQPVANPVETCRARQGVVTLSNHTLLVTRDGRYLAVEDSAAPIFDRDGRLHGVVMVFHDVSEKRALMQRMAWQMAHDSLTGLINRREFEDRLNARLAPPQEGGAARQHALLYLDLDQFKLVNDTAGHLVGDELLKQLGGLMQTRIRPGDTLARLGGDEFGLLLDDCEVEQALEIADGLRNLVRDFRFRWQDRVFDIGVSIGVVSIKPGGASLSQIMAAADMACYAAKDAGRNRVHLHVADDQEFSHRQRELLAAANIRAIIDEGRLRLYAQEIRPLRGGQTHYEVLLRFVDEQGALQPPAALIPAAERYGLMGDVDRWVISRSFETLGRGRLSFSLAINLSGLSLQDEDFGDFVVAELARTGADPGRVCLEITETSAISNLGKAVAFIRRFKELGFAFALDDFGVGMSSFSYLKNLPVDYIKIDGSFVKDIVSDPIDRAFVETINRIAQVMGKETIAEFVENDAILRELTYIGVNYAQGYGIARPAPFEQVKDLGGAD